MCCNYYLIVAFSKQGLYLIHFCIPTVAVCNEHEFKESHSSFSLFFNQH